MVKTRKGAFMFIVGLLVTLAVSIGFATVTNAQTVQTPCGAFNTNTLSATDLNAWNRLVATNTMCAQFQNQAQQIALAQGEFGLRQEIARWQMGHTDRNTDRQFALANKQLDMQWALVQQQIRMHQEAQQAAIANQQMGMIIGTGFGIFGATQQARYNRHR